MPCALFSCTNNTPFYHKQSLLPIHNKLLLENNTILLENNSLLPLLPLRYQGRSDPLTLLLGDINIDTEDEKAKGRTKLSEFCDIFDLENLINGSTCDTIRYASTSIDVIMSDKKSIFKNS